MRNAGACVVGLAVLAAVIGPWLVPYDPSAQELRQYHYQLWTDPPARVLQRRLIEQLRDANIAGSVTDELPASHPAAGYRRPSANGQ